jgi:hypothetical protein
MFGKLIFYVCLIAIGCYLIIKEEQIAQFERDLFERIKSACKSFAQPEKVVVLPKESEASKQARFNSGKAAGDELYMEVVKK